MNNETVILQEILNSMNILEDQQSFDFHVIKSFLFLLARDLVKPIKYRIHLNLVITLGLVVAPPALVPMASYRVRK